MSLKFPSSLVLGSCQYLWNVLIKSSVVFCVLTACLSTEVHWRAETTVRLICLSVWEFREFSTLETSVFVILQEFEKSNWKLPLFTGKLLVYFWLQKINCTAAKSSEELFLISSLQHFGPYREKKIQVFFFQGAGIHRLLFGIKNDSSLFCSPVEPTEIWSFISKEDKTPAEPDKEKDKEEQTVVLCCHQVSVSCHHICFLHI